MNRQTLLAIYEKTHGHCWYCAGSFHPLGPWEVEHQIPRVKGGSDNIDNLVLACRGCNIRKGNRTVDEYRHSLMVRLENKITEALEFAEEIEGYVGWPEGEPPSWLSSVSSALQNAAEGAATFGTLKFYGESVDLDSVIPTAEEMREINAEVMADEADLPH